VDDSIGARFPGFDLPAFGVMMIRAGLSGFRGGAHGVGVFRGERSEPLNGRF
jgi:hypothetical protein